MLRTLLNLLEPGLIRRVLLDTVGRESDKGGTASNNRVLICHEDTH